MIDTKHGKYDKLSKHMSDIKTFLPKSWNNLLSLQQLAKYQ